MNVLDETELDCLRRYLSLLAERLSGRLVEVLMFGSAARGDMWPADSPMHSDIDLLVVTTDEPAEAEQEELINQTYPLFLECGRQLSPHFIAQQRAREPGDERTREFLSLALADGVRVWP